MRSSPLPSLQYDSPRPDNCRGEFTARCPSNSECTQTNSPLSALIWSSGEYLVPARSPVECGHSPFLVEGPDFPFLVPDWPDTPVVIHTSPTTSKTNAGTIRHTVRDIVRLRFYRELNLLFHSRHFEPHPVLIVSLNSPSALPRSIRSLSSSVM